MLEMKHWQQEQLLLHLNLVLLEQLKYPQQLLADHQYPLRLLMRLLLQMRFHHHLLHRQQRQQLHHLFHHLQQTLLDKVLCLQYQMLNFLLIHHHHHWHPRLLEYRHYHLIQQIKTLMLVNHRH